MIICDETIEPCHKETKIISIGFTEKERTCKTQTFCMPLTFLLIIIILLLIIIFINYQLANTK